MLTDSAHLLPSLASRIRRLRTAQRLSLEALAERSGVSRSMISLVERGHSSPTAVVLERLATALGITMASLFTIAEPLADTPLDPVARLAEQPCWQDPASGYTRRSVTPAGISQPMQIVEVHFPARARVAFETGSRHTRVCQQIWLLEGTMEITIDDANYRLHTGDCLGMELDRPTMFYNPTDRASRYAVIIASMPTAHPTSAAAALTTWSRT